MRNMLTDLLYPDYSDVSSKAIFLFVLIKIPTVEDVNLHDLKKKKWKKRKQNRIEVELSDSFYSFKY